MGSIVRNVWAEYLAVRDVICVLIMSVGSLALYDCCVYCHYNQHIVCVCVCVCSHSCYVISSNRGVSSLLMKVLFLLIIIIIIF